MKIDLKNLTQAAWGESAENNLVQEMTLDGIGTFKFIPVTVKNSADFIGLIDLDSLHAESLSIEVQKCVALAESNLGLQLVITIDGDTLVPKLGLLNLKED